VRGLQASASTGIPRNLAHGVLKFFFPPQTCLVIRILPGEWLFGSCVVFSWFFSSIANAFGAPPMVDREGCDGPSVRCRSSGCRPRRPTAIAATAGRYAPSIPPAGGSNPRRSGGGASLIRTPGPPPAPSPFVHKRPSRAPMPDGCTQRRGK